MSGESIGSRIAILQQEWEENVQFLSSSPQTRLELETHLTALLTRIEQVWYDSEDVLQAAEKTTSEIPDSITPPLESAFSESLYGLEEEIDNALESDRENADVRPDLKDILTKNIDLDSIEEGLEDTEYSLHNIKSTLFGEVANTSRHEEKKTLDLYDLTEQIRNCREELGSSDFNRRYRKELVDPIQQYLTQENTEISLERHIPELLGELYSSGWGEDSMEEAIDILDSPNAIDEFCDVLRSEKYMREYCVPLPDDRISEPHLHVAGVDFYMQDCDEFTFLEELIDMDGRTEKLVEPLAENTNFFAVLHLVAPTQEVGEKRMEKKLERAIDALNYSKTKGVVQSPFTQVRTTYICQSREEHWNISTSDHDKYSIPHEFNVVDEAMNSLREDFYFFDGKEGNHTSLERRFIQSYRWYGDGVQSGILEEEFLKYIISMESMLVPESSGGKKDKLAQRLADLLGVYETHYDSFRDEVTELYNTRNNLVHNAEIDVQNMDHEVSSARAKATQMFGVLLEEYIDDYDDMSELLEDIEERDPPEAPTDYNR